MSIQIQDYEARLTETEDERRLVRRLRYKCFVEEEGASVIPEMKRLREEWDEFDVRADYMVVFHKKKVVGTYRIITREIAKKSGFYTETEFNLKKIKRVRKHIAEMSRACVDSEYRDNAMVIRMLWMGLAEYVKQKNIKLLFGVASWHGANPNASAQALSYLYYKHLAPPLLRPAVITKNFAKGVDKKLGKMNLLPRKAVSENLAFAQMSPLIRGYLRLGAEFGRGVFVDRPFNTYDVFVILRIKKLAPTYRRHFMGE
ncbi:MAG: GNAT family N-acetyltransferase [Rickettsiales bacterium]|jgi:putative hemolysin|nr:GNAT family N-acetyltransferase [Rickettsiales bacterium]